MDTTTRLSSAGVPIPAPSTLARCAAILRRILGVPDYDAYLTHMTTHQPDAIPLTQREFERARLNERYKQPGSRCC